MTKVVRVSPIQSKQKADQAVAGMEKSQHDDLNERDTLLEGLSLLGESTRKESQHNPAEYES